MTSAPASLTDQLSSSAPELAALPVLIAWSLKWQATPQALHTLAAEGLGCTPRVLMNPNPSNPNPKPSMHWPQEVAQACCRTLTHAPVLPCLWYHLIPAALYGRSMQHLLPAGSAGQASVSQEVASL